MRGHGFGFRPLLIVWLKVRVLSGSQAPNEPLNMSVERFLSMIRFDSKEKLKDLPLELGK